MWSPVGPTLVTQRPQCLVAVTGTGTSVGKTWVTAATIRDLRERGWRVAARKPAQSYAESDPTPTDAFVLAAASGEEEGVVCLDHRSYPLALAPPMAAAALGLRPVAINDLSNELSASWPSEASIDVAFVEGAGGVASPQAVDGDMATLIELIDADHVVLVAESGLGALNLVRLCIRFLGGDRPTTLHLNRFDSDSELHRSNRRWLVEHEGLEVTTDIATLAARIANLVQAIPRS
jgi:dethiobiotin synthetase